jgi:3,4-dihydroxy 2-butanone 4-phosphate synthase/GTP cyclohydrolase II
VFCPVIYLRGFFVSKKVNEQNTANIHFDPLMEAVEAFRGGEMLVVTDDEYRENEGDLVLSAEKVTPEAINFMATHGRGLICVALDEARTLELGLAHMPQHGGGNAFRTAFLESVDAKKNVTTGISSADRTETVRALGQKSPPQRFIPFSGSPVRAKRPDAIME